MEAKQIERLISTKASPIDLCTGKWNNGCPTGCCRCRAASWALPALFQCKRQPNVCPQLESLCESTADYVGISVVVSHKYARTHAHTHTRIHLHTPWSAASGRSRDSIRYTHSLYAGFGLFVCMLVCMCVCAIFYALHGNSKTPTSSRATTTTTTTTTRAKQSAAHKQQQQQPHEAVKLKSEQTLPKLCRES